MFTQLQTGQVMAPRGSYRCCADKPVRPSSKRRSSRERGNAILEGALIFLPMMALMLGIVDVSLAVYVQTTLTNASREGARFAVTYSPTYKGTSCAASQATCIQQVVQDNALGIPIALTSSYITVNYYSAYDLTHPVEVCNPTCARTAQALNATPPPARPVTNVNQPGQIVEVVIAGYPWNWLVPLRGYSAGTGITLGATSVDVMGGLAVGTTQPPNP